MSARSTALEAQRYADTLEDEIGAPVDWDDISNAYLVAADAWLEAGEPEEAAHQLLRAAEYRRWAIDEQREVVPGGIARSAIDMRTGQIDPAYVWQWNYLPVLSIDEAAEIARLAGWLELRRHHIPEVDRNGRPNPSRLDWLFWLTNTRRAGTTLDDFRTRLAGHLESRRSYERDAGRRRR